MRITLLASVAVLVAACGSGAPSPTQTPLQSVPFASLAVQPTTQPTAAPTVAPPSDAAPAELQGIWKTVIAPGDNVTLTLRGTTYKIVRGGFTGVGHIAVAGDQIVFSEASECKEGAGTYTWSIASGSLTFTQVGSLDPCPRHEVLLGHAYAK